MKLDLSSTGYLRLTVPQVYDSTASGLCGNFNGDRSDDLELRTGHLAKSFGQFLHSWAEPAPGQHCTDTCGRECNKCSLSPNDSVICDALLIGSTEFSHCWNSSIERDIYVRVCVTALCAGAGQMASCLALEAYSAACQAKGIAVGAWRENTPCGKWSILITFKPSKWSTLNDFKLLPPAFQCPDRSSPAECVDSSSCPALLHPGSLASGCSEGCQCHYGNVFDEGECVPYSQCGCVLHGVYIKVNIHALYILKETLSAVVGCIQILYFKSTNIAPWKYCIKNHQWYINLN